MQHRVQTVVIASVVLLAVIAAQAQAVIGVKPGARAGYYFDPEAFFVGAEADIHLTMFHLIPNIEWAFPDNADLWTFNADGYVTLPFIPATDTWVGGGIAWVRIDPDKGDTKSDVGLNLFGGFGLNLPLNPYVQLKYLIVDSGNGFVLGVGARF